MNIAIVGYGKMGKIIERIALERGHEVSLKIGSKNRDDLNPINLSKCDVVIEFSTPESGFQNVHQCIDSGIPTISGTTGWLDKLEQIHDLTKVRNTAFLYASNFSLGVNLFFALNTKLAELMKPFPQYSAQIEEIHHTSKKDSPSGTGITLAEQVIDHSAYDKWVNHDKPEQNELSIISKRIDPAPGTHIISYSSVIDTIDIKHTAHSREGFALGAVIAAEWIAGKVGIFSMKDVLGL